MVVSSPISVRTQEGYPKRYETEDEIIKLVQEGISHGSVCEYCGGRKFTITDIKTKYCKHTHYKRPPEGAKDLKIVVEKPGWILMSLKIKCLKCNAIVYEQYFWDVGSGAHAASPYGCNEAPGYREKEGCFIATAAYGTHCAAELQILRKFRNEHLLKNTFGRLFVNAYYQVSPAIASLIEKHEMAKSITRTILIKPILLIIKNLGIYR